METNLALVDAFQGFMATARPYVIITDEEDYNKALEALEQILETTEDTENSSLNPLIDMLSHAIEKYEVMDTELNTFIDEAEELPADIALLRTLMRQYNLSGSDFPEIGCKSMVSKVLKGERLLSRTAIEQLSKRFGLRAALFFGELGV